jgi:hypothetical protein
MLSCQGYLLAGYFVLSKGATDNPKSLIIAIICVLSAMIAWRIRVAIKQGEEVIDKVHKLERQVFIEAKETKELEKYFLGFDVGRHWGDGQKDIHHILSFACQREIPWGFVVIWCVFFLVSIGPKFAW